MKTLYDLLARLRYKFSRQKPHLAIGRYGEDLAANHLRSIGMNVRARNFIIKKHEVDIIAVDKGVIVFVEVKARGENSYGAPAEAVTHKVQKRLTEAANLYLAKYKLHDSSIRFDVIGVDVSDDGKFSLMHIKSAF